MDRIISLGVGTEGAEDYFSTFQDISELARNLGATHDYVNVSARAVVEDSEDEKAEELYHDENTIAKVRSVLQSHGLTDDQANSIINGFQNFGLLFRERR
jgi:hypothetical protein